MDDIRRNFFRDDLVEDRRLAPTATGGGCDSLGLLFLPSSRIGRHVAKEGGGYARPRGDAAAAAARAVGGERCIKRVEVYKALKHRVWVVNGNRLREWVLNGEHLHGRIVRGKSDDVPKDGGRYRCGVYNTMKSPILYAYSESSVHPFREVPRGKQV